MYTVKKLADLAGVTVRTLPHYDEIGLLMPSSVGGNDYRSYGEDALYRLQQILFYRELEVPLDDIKRILGSPDFDVLSALESHRTALQAAAQRIKRLIRTIDLTTQHLKGKVPMGDRQLFRGFSEEEQEKMAVEAEQQWGGSVRASNARWKQYSIVPGAYYTLSPASIHKLKRASGKRWKFSQPIPLPGKSVALCLKWES